MPILTWKCPTTQALSRSVYECGDGCNITVTFMHVSCDVHAQSDADVNIPPFGWAPMRYQNDVGTQLIARADRESLNCEIVETFGSFCHWHLVERIQKCWESEEADGIEDDGPNKHRRKVLDEITPEKWTEYQSQWKAEKAEVAAAKGRGAPEYTLEKASAGLERMGLTENDSERIGSILTNSHEALLRLYKLKFGEQ